MQIRTSVSPAEARTEGKVLAERRAGKFELTREVIEEVEDCGALGLTLDETAHCVGIEPVKLREQKRVEAEFLAAITRGRSRGLRKMTGFLRDQAESGNTHATIFYLKNRAPDTWANDVNAVSKIQINLARISDSELLTELRDDEALSNVVDQNMIEIEQKGTSNVHHVGLD